MQAHGPQHRLQELGWSSQHEFAFSPTGGVAGADENPEAERVDDSGMSQVDDDVRMTGHGGIDGRAKADPLQPTVSAVMSTPLSGVTRPDSLSLPA